MDDIPCALSAALLVRNEAPRIRACLGQLHFCGEIVVVDDGSTDGTVELVEDFARESAVPVRMFQRAMRNFGEQREFARQQCNGRWMLVLDADESLSPLLVDSILACVHADGSGLDAFVASFRDLPPLSLNPADGLRSRHPRLLRRDGVFWEVSDTVHSHVTVPTGKWGTLDGVVVHRPHDRLEDLIRKSVRYGLDGGRALSIRGHTVGVPDAVAHAACAFLQAFFRRGGWRLGGAGAVASMGAALTTLIKYLRAWELAQLPEDRRREEHERALPPARG